MWEPAGLGLGRAGSAWGQVRSLGHRGLCGDQVTGTVEGLGIDPAGNWKAENGWAGPLRTNTLFPLPGRVSPPLTVPLG